MKSKQDFSTEDQYKEYLNNYYAGLAMQAMCVTESQNERQSTDENAKRTAENAIKFSNELVKQLIPEKR